MVCFYSKILGHRKKTTTKISKPKSKCPSYTTLNKLFIRFLILRLIRKGICFFGALLFFLAHVQFNRPWSGRACVSIPPISIISNLKLEKNSPLKSYNWVPVLQHTVHRFHTLSVHEMNLISKSDGCFKPLDSSFISKVHQSKTFKMLNHFHINCCFL